MCSKSQDHDLQRRNTRDGTDGLGRSRIALAGRRVDLCGTCCTDARSRGEYVYIREAYGPSWSFLYGWTQFIIVYTASAAAKAVAFALFLNVLTGGLLDANYVTLNIFGHPVPIGRLQLVSLTVVTVITLINCLAVSLSGRVASFLTLLKMMLLAAVGLGAFFLAPGDWTHMHLSGLPAPAKASLPARAAAGSGSEPPCWARSGRTMDGAT